MVRTLITGIHGFTGRYMAARLVGQGDEVHGLAQGDGHVVPDGVCAVHVCPLQDADALVAVIGKVRPQRIAHLAAVSFVAHGDVDEIYSTNLIGSRNLLQAVVEAGVAPTAVLLASSANIYGNSRAGILDEDIPPAPANDYGVSKLAMEYCARLFSDRIPIIIARPFNYTGVGQTPNFIVPKIVDHVLRHASKIELGNIDVARDFSDVRGVVDAYARLLATPVAVGGIYNVCSGTAYTLREVLSLASAISGHALTVEVNPDFVRPNEVRSLCGSASKLEAVIGKLDMPSLEQTLRWMIKG
jgi:nucleoside-diphosphate-sugar epimerase